MKYRVSKKDKSLKGTIHLEGSKSITNRVVIIKALCPDFFEINNFSVSDDSMNLIELLDAHDKVLRCGEGGTTIRFLTALMAVHDVEVVLTGEASLLKRPISPLVDALRSLGAEIEYLGYEGHPPLLVKGTKLVGNRVEVDASVSSQFISALLLIAPILQDGLLIRMKGDVVSKSYIQMTLNVMKHFGIHHEWTQSVVSVPHQDYVGRKFNVESDWSAASYYYSMAALADEVDLKLMGLNKMSFQGDAVLASIMHGFGVETTHIEGGVHLTKTDLGRPPTDYDFRDCPDIAQTVLACAAAKGVALKARGLETLLVKETDRVAAMGNELDKYGVHFTPLGSTWNLAGNATNADGITIDTYKDHRMAMSFVPMAMKFGEVVINDPMVVSKSYPGFWEDIQKLGFQIEEFN